MNDTPEYFYEKKNLCVVMKKELVSVSVSEEVFEFMRKEEERRHKSTENYNRRMVPLDRDGQVFEIPDWETPEDILLAKEREQELAEKVRKLLDDTKPLNRTIIEVCIMGENSQRSLAKELGISEKALSKRLIRSMSAMRKSLEAERECEAENFYDF